MKANIASFLVGLLFAIGLGVSGMTQPHRVISFLDIFGNWDSSLEFVMLSAVFVYAISYRLIKRRSSPVFAADFKIPHRKDIDRNLVIGAILFGAGWGIAGYCPAPALTALATFTVQPFVFVLSLLTGMTIFKFTGLDKNQKALK